jgi:hypothetical protein
MSEQPKLFIFTSRKPVCCENSTSFRSMLVPAASSACLAAGIGASGMCASAARALPKRCRRTRMSRAAQRGGPLRLRQDNREEPISAQ